MFDDCCVNKVLTYIQRLNDGVSTVVLIRC